MVESCDVGSLPFVGDIDRFLSEASGYGRVVDDSTQFFESCVVSGFVDKIQAGIDVPNYTQYRDMTEMFLGMIDGLTKVDGGYVESGGLALKAGEGVINEVQAIRSSSGEVFERVGRSFKLRVCVTGPYSLSSVFAYKDARTFARLGNVLARIVDANIFNDKCGGVKLVSVDDPVFGFVDDPLLDRGSEGRENLLKAWETIMQKVRAKGAQTCLHLHNTSDELFWDVESLNVIESHVDDGLYQAKRTKERLEATDKFLKVSVAVTDFDQVIRTRLMAGSGQKMSEAAVNEGIADVWKGLRSKSVDPALFLEDVEVMRQRLKGAVERFGEDRVLYAGPECGLRGFPTYESAVECLRRVSAAVRLPAV